MSRRIVLVDIGSGLTLSGVLPSVALHGSYNAKLIARGGLAPYTFTTASVLPEGLSLDRATGIFSATDVATPGTFAIVVTVTDISGATVTRAFVLQVIPQPLTIAGDAPNGATGTAYAYTYAVTGGTPPYAWSIVAGALPNGVAIDSGVGEISGMPQAGNYAWTVRCTDSAGITAELSDACEIIAVNPLVWAQTGTKTKSSTVSYTSIYGSTRKSSGKWQYEIIVSTPSPNDFVGGIDETSGASANPLGAGPTSAFSLRNSGQRLASFPSGKTNNIGSVHWVSNDVITVTLDLDSTPPTAAIYVNGVKAFDVTGMPTGRSWTAAWSSYSGGSAVTLASAIQYPVAGYSDWV